ncbi:Ig-like domain-containing protein [Haloarchaeobius sp. TZWSO28]|uniref:Ig-like domain-containing protein n=1 Tax=Haloarchaeobius sp. TZWSO28 TaxID=3446119 RepID=UPI003EBBA7C5
MPTLPDGATVSSQHTEDFESIGLAGLTLRHTETFEDPIFIMGDFTVSVTATIVQSGGTTTVNGSATDTEGNPEAGAPYTVKADLDGTTKVSANGSTDASGDFSETLTLTDPGDYTVYAENAAVGQQHVEDFESIGMKSLSLRDTERFEDF